MDTKHGQARANQRGYPTDLLELIRAHGSWDGDRQTLTRRGVLAYLAAHDAAYHATRRNILRLLDKGGGVLVCAEDDDALITVFNPRTYRRASRRQRTYSPGRGET